MELTRPRECAQRMADDSRLLKINQHHYDSSMPSVFHFLSNENHENSAFVILPKNDYEVIKKDIISVKQSLNELKNFITFELQQLKQDSNDLLKQIEKCRCEQQQNELLTRKNSNNAWNLEGNWENHRPLFSGMPILGDGNNICSPITSTPERCRVSSEIGDISSFSSISGVVGTAKTEMLPPPDNKQVQLLPNYDVFVNKLNLQIIINEGMSHKDNGALYVLRRLIPLVFTWEELAYSRGQGLNCKSSEDVSNKFPLDPTKVVVCKAYMRKFCLEAGVPEPTERAINQTFSHQVNYARRRIKEAKEPKIPSVKKGQKRGRKPKNHSQEVKEHMPEVLHFSTTFNS